MSNREEFEKALALYESKCVTGSSALVRKIASHFYDVRQPEIDALQTENERLRKALPSTPEAVIAFIGSNFSSKSKSLDGDLASVKYVLTVHDLISAFSSLFDAAAPTPPTQHHPIDDADIRAIALDCGFRLKPQPDGAEDLNPYVYRFARKILSTTPRAEDVEAPRQRPTPPARKSETDDLYGYVDEFNHLWSVDEARPELEDGNHIGLRPVYTRPDNSELRKAAEALILAYDNHEYCITEIADLRAALEGK